MALRDAFKFIQRPLAARAGVAGGAAVAVAKLQLMEAASTRQLMSIQLMHSVIGCSLGDRSASYRLTIFFFQAPFPAGELRRRVDQAQPGYATDMTLVHHLVAQLWRLQDCKEEPEQGTRGRRQWPALPAAVLTAIGASDTVPNISVWYEGKPVARRPGQAPPRRPPAAAAGGGVGDHMSDSISPSESDLSDSSGSFPSFSSFSSDSSDSSDSSFFVPVRR